MKPVTIGPCTLYLGDCREILSTLSGIDAIVTDPPYGIGYLHSGGGKGKHTRRNLYAIVGDDAPFDPAWLLEFRSVIMWGADHYANRLPRGRWLVWDKLDGMDTFDNFSDVEVAWHNRPGAARIFRHLWKGICQGSDKEVCRLHPSQKPTALMGWCIEQSGCGHGDVIADPYMGSGTTGIACIRTGRKFIGIEIEPRYYQISCERIQREVDQFTLPLEIPKQPKQETLF